jgi:ribonuclease P protein subunit POP4
MINPGNVLQHELIGLGVLVVNSRNPSQKGISGIIIDETRNTLVVDTGKGEKRIQKGYCTFRLSLPDSISVEVQGSAFVGSPERRINMNIRR